MKMKNLIDLYKEIEDSYDSGFKNQFNRFEGVIDSVGDYLNENANLGKKIVTSKIDEKEFVACLDFCRALLLSSMVVASSGKGRNLFMAEISGELKTYTDTIVMSVLGMLADEEVI